MLHETKPDAVSPPSIKVCAIFVAGCEKAQFLPQRKGSYKTKISGVSALCAWSKAYGSFHKGEETHTQN